MEVTRLDDGRMIEHVEVGAPHGRPVVYLHGTPGTAGCAVLFDDVARRADVRVLAVSRPGYGETATSAPGLLPVARDVGELMTALGIDDFATWGASGGGPYALAVAAAFPDRVHQVLIAAGLAPVHRLDPTALTPDDDRALALLAAGESDAAVSLMMTGAAEQLGALQSLSAADFGPAFRALVPPGENYFDDRPGEAAAFFADVHRALRRLDGYVRDNLSWLGPWDFDLAGVEAPVVLAYGDLDAMVPAAHGTWLDAHLPTSSLTVHPGAGHGEVTFGRAAWLLSTLTPLPEG